jgi:membrane protease YdiL (CAAX protease family)
MGLLTVWLLAGLTVYSYVFRRVAGDGGKVSTQEFKEPDLILAVAFIGWVGFNLVTGFGQPERDVTQKEIVHGAATFVLILGMLLMFMQFRGIYPMRQFGLTRVNFFRCIALGAGLVIAAHPLVLVTEGLTDIAMHGQAQPQNVVEFFLNASEKSDFKAVATMLVLAVIVAPVAEETIFRGYLYGVLKRYIGGIGAAVVSAGLFAAMHMNVAALPALFVLALCLTLAYEATGSLLVNICMHAFFNLSMLLIILLLTGHMNPT